MGHALAVFLSLGALAAELPVDTGDGEPRPQAASIASSTTSTVGLMDAFGEDPLSADDLALLEELDGAQTATTVAPAPISAFLPMAPAGIGVGLIAIPRSRLREAAPRSARESIDARASGIDGFRPRSRVLTSLDGLRLPRGELGEGWLDVAPQFFERVRIARESDLIEHADPSTLSLETSAAPRPDEGFDLDTALAARTADRSLDAFASVGGGVDMASLRVSAAFQTVQELRTITSTQTRELPASARRLTLFAKSRILGRPDDPLEITFGAGLDRSMDATIPSPRTNRVLGTIPDEQRRLLYLAAHHTSERIALALSAGALDFARTTKMLGGTSIDESQSALQAQATGRLALPGNLAARAGAFVEGGRSDAPGTANARRKTEHTRMEGALGLAYSTEALKAETSGRFVHHSARLENILPSTGFTVDEPLFGAKLWAQIFGALGAQASLHRGLHVPSFREVELVPVASEAELVTSLSVGPTIRAAAFELELGAYHQWMERPIGVNRKDARILGLDVIGAWMIVPRLEATWAFGWAEELEAGDEPYRPAVPSLSGLGALRYALGARAAYIESTFRFATGPVPIFSVEPMDGYGPFGALGELFASEPRPFLRVGLAGGLELFEGLSAQLALENVFDSPHRPHEDALFGAGVDLRLGLAYRHP